MVKPSYEQLFLSSADIKPVRHKETITPMFECTKENPWREGLPTPVRHHNVREVGEQEYGYPGGDIVKMRCANCGATWRKELPQ